MRAPFVKKRWKYFMVFTSLAKCVSTPFKDLQLLSNAIRYTRTIQFQSSIPELITGSSGRNKRFIVQRSGKTYWDTGSILPQFFHKVNPFLVVFSDLSIINLRDNNSMGELGEFEIGDRIDVGDLFQVREGGAGNTRCDNALITESYTINGNPRQNIYYRFCGTCPNCLQIGLGVGNQNYAYPRDFIRIIKKIEDIDMKKKITKGSYVKIIDPGKAYPDMDEKGKELGANLDKWFKTAPAKDQEGTVIGIDEGFVLMENSDESHIMIDVDGVTSSKKSSEISHLVYYVDRKVIEEFSSASETNERIQKLFVEGAITLSSNIKLYEVSGSKKVSLKLDVFLG